jgi:hypothetical protein
VKLEDSEAKAALDGAQIEVESWSELHERLSRMTDTAWLFRGVSSAAHYPIPSIGREDQYGKYDKLQEERLFRVFKDRAVALLPSAVFDDWSWLAYAQHLGIPTRLLDWTTSPLMAVFFALNAHNN